ncbi:MAG: hypothetical protein LJE58_08075 [Thiogranum sp.]|jgi:hypothetical protein|nr:hypothetical protein [Thiogranum sp.]
MTCRGLTTLLVALTVGSGMAAAAAADSAAIKQWQMARLLNPTQVDQKAEAKGRVMIYDGMTDQDVARAFGEQFDRLEYMMFTRTVVTDESGQPRKDPNTGELVTESVYDDGCD